MKKSWTHAEGFMLCAKLKSHDVIAYKLLGNGEPYCDEGLAIGFDEDSNLVAIRCEYSDDVYNIIAPIMAKNICKLFKVTSAGRVNIDKYLNSEELNKALEKRHSNLVVYGTPVVTAVEKNNKRKPIYDDIFHEFDRIELYGAEHNAMYEDILDSYNEYMSSMYNS